MSWSRFVDPLFNKLRKCTPAHNSIVSWARANLIAFLSSSFIPLYVNGVKALLWSFLGLAYSNHWLWCGQVWLLVWLHYLDENYVWMIFLLHDREWWLDSPLLLDWIQLGRRNVMDQSVLVQELLLIQWFCICRWSIIADYILTNVPGVHCCITDC